MLKEYFVYLLTCDGCGAQKPSQTDKKVQLAQVKLPKGWKEAPRNTHFCKEKCYLVWYEKQKPESNPFL